MIFEPGLLAGKVAIVTGAGTGIGRGITLELARAGADMVLAGRRPEPLEAVKAEVEALGRRAIVTPTDVKSWDQVQAMVAAANAAFGHVDILVNNAGGQFSAPFHKLSPNGWKAVIDLNLNGVFNCTRAVAEGMIAQHGGKVINIINGSARRSAPNISHSGASRAGVENLARSLAVEWGPHNIQVNCISPIVLTEQLMQASGEAGTRAMVNNIPAGRAASAEEVGWLVVFLASRAGDYITGEHILIDGGYWNATGVGPGRYGT
jgi:citronellol/citronellal dehydrogenase